MTTYAPEICIYHGDCLDGFGAAWAIWKRWRACEFRPGYYGRDLPLEGVDGKNVLFVDFSASHETLVELANRAESVIVLDHHKTAKAELEAFVTNDIIVDFHAVLERRTSAGGLPIVAFFEEDRSGAAMAWEFACGNALPPVLSYIQDRDLWRFYYGEDTKAVAAALQSYPMEFDIWDAMMLDSPRLITEGQALLRLNRMNVGKMLKETRSHTIGGHTVPVVNVPYFHASDAGNELLRLHPEAPFSATYFDRADGFRQWSLRSEAHRMDVSQIAKALGGGGHRNAAGFQEPAPTQTPPPESHLEGLNDEQRGVGMGMAIAAGIIMRSWGNDTYAREILGAAGLDTLDKLRASGVDQYDIDALLPVVCREGSDNG